MFKTKKIKYEFQKRTFIRIVMAVFIMALISTPGLMNNGKVLADSTRPDISCGHDSICKSIEGNEFDMILYSSAGSEMVILFNESTVGKIIPKTSESYYARAKGTVKDAIYYLSRDTNYEGFRFKRARKSTGFFRSQVIDGVYVVIPDYEDISDHRPPEYYFSDRDGKLKVGIRPVIRDSNN